MLNEQRKQIWTKLGNAFPLMVNLGTFDPVRLQMNTTR